jgi:hypothetical protein
MLLLGIESATMLFFRVRAQNSGMANEETQSRSRRIQKIFFIDVTEKHKRGSETKILYILKCNGNLVVGNFKGTHADLWTHLRQVHSKGKTR